jgi:thiol:disulfide interchange protein DsbC
MTNEQIINYFKSQTEIKELNITVKDRRKVPDYPKFEFVVIEISQINKGDGHIKYTPQKLNILIKDDFIFPEAIDIKNYTSLRQKAGDELLLLDLAKIYKNETKDNIIFLGDTNKPSLVILSNPECLYCRQELLNIEIRLRTNSIKMILIPQVPSALRKSALIYEEIANAKTDEQKITVLRKYYDENLTMLPNANEKSIENADMLSQKYLKTGIENIPVVIEEKKLLSKQVP